MYFEQRTFTVAKDASKPLENQDALACDPARGIAALADGATSSLQSGRWARLLVEGVVAGPPDIAEAATFPAWLAARREAWQSGLDEKALAWHQKARLADGAFSTLLWIELATAENGALAMRGFALGDSCLLHIRGGKVLRSFPIEESRLFGTEPVLLGSAPRQSAESLAFDTLDDTCESGDLLVLATDAVAAWALTQLEAGRPLGLESLWDMADEDFARWITRLRDQQQIRYDDSTVVLLRMIAPDQTLASREAVREIAADPLGQVSRWARRLWDSTR
ncbi:MAG: protein phosphatase 2C domain-containing protein [Planctomycetes bacterium]|nr:protein phosphatase 2C domain-containing protein [Planctomycetota bacterium]